MFTGLSAFPITPLTHDRLDPNAYANIIGRLADIKVDSICALGSTGLYPYLNAEEKGQVIRVAVEHAGDVPVLAGIGSLRLRDVLANAEQAEKLGVKGLLLAPLSYQRLTEEEVYELYRLVDEQVSVPICVYDNPVATHFTFSDELHSEIAKLKMIQSIKFPGTPFVDAGEKRIQQLKGILPADVTIGVSGDAFAASGIQSGCDIWYSVLAGLFPRTAQHIFHRAKECNSTQAKALSQEFEPLWDMFTQNLGGMRVMATAAEILGYAEAPCLPAPLTGLNPDSQALLRNLISELELS
ncbi:dihydrodipicolinate synthase family protein [Vibrio nigripulchritudo]|uniref:dihydrodipicolinate synthase family protein n=1 Tax=Vibrio nigripulchritudo TaxID=28173 RepID=UPI0005FA1DC8|nr:dihydrodipicolinate synthase family protein [Vibrio nigripulchritudo]KJY73636.1 dihydrodipicolinate synthase [Vibrio nigripulchritudo]